MWSWWCTQRTNLRVVDGIQTPNLEAADLEAVELEVQGDAPDLVSGAVSVPTLEAADVTTLDDTTIEGGQIG